MADTPKIPPQERRKAQAAAPAVSPPMPRRRLARHEREVRNQRRVVILTATAIGMAILAVIIGLSYDQIWVPSRPVAQVGAVSLSRRDYWQEQRLAYARQIAQNFYLVARFGGNQQFTQQFANQSPTINRQAQTIRTSPVDDGVVAQWETLQIKLQGVAALGVSVSDDEITQALANDMGQFFIPPPAPPITSTAAISGTTAPATGATAAVLATATLVPTATPIPTVAASPTPGGPTATPEPTSTTAPTSTPNPTPQAAEAAIQLGQIVDEIYRRYEIELASAQLKPALTKDDFRAALIVQYRDQVLNTKVETRLVPESTFEVSSEPKKVKARQILIAVSPLADATQAQIDTLFQDAKARADALVADLRKGASFADVATATSSDPGSSNVGGDIGLFDKDGTADNGATYPPELAKAAFSLAQNTVSEPIRTQFGWHIIEVTERQVPTKDAQLRDARTKALDTWLADQRAASSTQRFPPQTPTLTPGVTETPTVVSTYQPGPPTQVPTPLPTLAPTVGGTTAPSTPTAGDAVSSTPTAGDAVSSTPTAGDAVSPTPTAGAAVSSTPTAGAAVSSTPTP
ncbi:MAG: peptidylprolyl isomerase [Chloroflexales bacterium]